MEIVLREAMERIDARQPTLAMMVMGQQSQDLHENAANQHNFQQDTVPHS